MKLSYYTIDDLRLGYDPKGVTGWRMSQFLKLDDALEHYRSLPASGLKSIGMTNGIQVLELACCYPVFPWNKEGKDVLASDLRKLPDWAKVPEAAVATKACITALGLCFLLDAGQLVPIPMEMDTSNKALQEFFQAESMQNNKRGVGK